MRQAGESNAKYHPAEEIPALVSWMFSPCERSVDRRRDDED